MKSSLKVETWLIDEYIKFHPELKGTSKTLVLDIMLRKLLDLEKRES